MSTGSNKAHFEHRRDHPSSGSQRSVRDHRIAISIISDNALLREGLAAVLQPYLNLTIVGSYPAETCCDPQLPNPTGHVMLLDSGIGYVEAQAVTRHWRNLHPPAFVIVLELVNQVDTIIACIEAGAGGYTLQGASPADVVEAIYRVCHHMAYCAPEVTAELFARLAAAKSTATRIPEIASPLTPRELEVLQCISDGYSNRQIAERLVIEVRTVKHHVHNILEKLSVKHRWDAARTAHEHGWIAINEHG